MFSGSLDHVEVLIMATNLNFVSVLTCNKFSLCSQRLDRQIMGHAVRQRWLQRENLRHRLKAGRGGFGRGGETVEGFGAVENVEGKFVSSATI